MLTLSQRSKEKIKESFNNNNIKQISKWRNFLKGFRNTCLSKSAWLNNSGRKSKQIWREGTDETTTGNNSLE